MQGTWVCLPLVQEDSTCHGPTKPVCHEFWALALETVLHDKRSHCSEKRCTAARESLCIKDPKKIINRCHFKPIRLENNRALASIIRCGEMGPPSLTGDSINWSVIWGQPLNFNLRILILWSRNLVLTYISKRNSRASARRELTE